VSVKEPIFPIAVEVIPLSPRMFILTEMDICVV